MAEYPSMPLFTDAYLADTTHLTAQEHGAYLLLLMVSWRSADLRLPTDDKLLARYAKVDPRTWAKIKPTIMKFWTVSDGFMVQRKQQKVWDLVNKRAKASQENGRLGGRPKSLKNNDLIEPTGFENETQKKLTKTKTKEPYGSGKEEAKASSKSRGSRLPSDWQLPEEWRVWALAEGLQEPEVRRQADRFRDYWIAATGGKASKADWFATWRNWIRGNIDRQSAKKTVPAPAGDWRDDPIYQGVDVG